jgi:hypothetical protein
MKPASIAAVLAVFLVAAGTAAVADAGFRPPRDCRAGTTIFRDRDVRLFRTAGTIDGEQA